jgi:protein phosphatase
VNQLKYDVIGDVHGCYSEFILLVKKLGYSFEDNLLVHPEGRMLVFVGDITDRGPESIKMIEIVTSHVFAKKALYVPGNHCDKLYRYFIGRNVQIKHGLETTVAEYQELPKKEQLKIAKSFRKLYETAPLYLTLDDGKLIVSHAGINEELIGKQSKAVKRFVLYGDITGESDDLGMPIRRDWAMNYLGNPWIVYGHTPVKNPRKMNKTWNIDTGCVFGGKLTALRYPELETFSVPSSMPLVEEKFRSFD